MVKIDWNSIWDTQMLLTDRARLNDGGFWDKISNEERASPFTEELLKFQLECLALKGDETILEIGPGKGRLTKELARRAAHVTALDPSQGMIDSLTLTLSEEGIDNVDIIKGSLEDIEKTSVGEHDVVVASYSLFMMDMSKCLKMMTKLSRDRVVVFVPANIRIPVALQNILHGTDAVIQVPDHVMLFNILWDMGYPTDVLVKSYTAKREYEDLEAAVDEHMRFHNVPDCKRENMTQYVRSLVKYDGVRPIIEQERSTAMLRWRSV